MNRIIKRKIEKILILVLGISLGTAFIISLYLGNKLQSSEQLVARQVELYARSYLPGEIRAELGTKLDCSGFTRQVFRYFNIELSTNSAKQYKQTARLDSGELKKADLVFFNTNNKGISHVGIYLENNAFIHSPGRNRAIQIDSIHKGYFAAHFAGAGRIKTATIDNK